MWKAHLFANKYDLRFVQLITQSGYYTIMFCSNGLVFADNSSMFFVAKEDASLYETPESDGKPVYAQFSVTNVQNDHAIVVGNDGIRLCVSESENMRKFTLEVNDMKTLNTLAKFEVDYGFSSTGSRLDLQGDHLFRMMTYRTLEMVRGSRPLECPFEFPDDISDDDREIHMTVSGGKVQVTIRGNVIGCEDCKYSNFSHTIRFQEKRLRRLEQMLKNTKLIIGHVPGLSEIPHMYYFRISGYGTFSTILR